jgi:hypothetical protein
MKEIAPFFEDYDSTGGLGNGLDRLDAFLRAAAAGQGRLNSASKRCPSAAQAVVTLDRPLLPAKTHPSDRGPE